MTGFLRTLLFLVAMAVAAFPVRSAEPDDIVVLDLKDGRVVIEMRPDLAPKHVARIRTLIKEGYYDGLAFHRVIDGFMAQGGDPTGTGAGGSGVKLPAEFSRERHVRGTVSMARTDNPNSADSQFFIMFQPVASLDGKYTIWGKVVQGMEFVDRIKRGDEMRGGMVRNPDKIVRMRMASDVPDFTMKK